MKMLLKVTFVVTCTLIVSLCSCENPAEDYLLVNTGYYHKELQRIVKRIESGKWGDNLEGVVSSLRLLRDSALKALLENHNRISDYVMIDTSEYNSSRLYRLYTVAADLLSFHEPPAEGSFDCTNHQASVFMELIQVVFKSLKKFQVLLKNPNKSLVVQFMQKYGEKHSKECLGTLLERYDIFVKNLPKEVEKKMDALVSMGEKYELDQEDSRLLVQAENMNWAKGKFDAKKMMDTLISNNYLGEEAKTNKKLKSVELGKLLANFISETCETFHSAGIPFDMYNLAKIFVPEVVSALELPMKFKKLNQYSRICIPFDNYNLQRQSESNVVSNVIRQKVLKTLRFD